MSQNSSICDLFLNKSDDFSIESIDSHISTKSETERSIKTHNKVLTEDNESADSEVFIEKFLSTNDIYESQVQKINTKKRSKVDSVAEVKEVEVKDVQTSNQILRTNDTKHKTRKRIEFSPQKRLTALRLKGITDHYYVVDEEEPQTKLQCIVCSKGSHKKKWSIASNSFHTIRKHLDSNIHKRSAQQFQSNNSIEDQHFNQTMDLDSIGFDVDSDLNHIESTSKCLSLEELYSSWSSH